MQTFEWDSYLTVTFRHTRHDGTNAVNAVWQRLPTAPLRGFFAVEPHKLDGIHLHALLSHGALKHYSDSERLQAYCTSTFGWSKASILDEPRSGLMEYCSKYVTKGNEYFYMGMARWWRPAHWIDESFQGKFGL